MSDFLINNGMPKDAVIWLFMLPITATLVVASRQIIGIKGLGIGTPLLLGFAFAAIGLKFGLLILAAALIFGYLTRLVLSNIRLLYLPKIALIITGATLIIAFGVPFFPQSEHVIDSNFALFAFIIIILSLEQFYAFLAERGLRKIAGVTLETLLLAVLTFLTIKWAWLQQMVLSYPFIVAIAVVSVNLFLGRWTGLRLSEYMRFKDIIFK